MDSYHTLILLADAHRDDLLREAQPRLRPVGPKREWVSILSRIARDGRPSRRVRSVSGVAADGARASS
jgi:hypothetical protein